MIWRHDQTRQSLLPTPHPDQLEVPRDLHPQYPHRHWARCPSHHMSRAGPPENREIQGKIQKSKMGGIRRATVNGLVVVSPIFLFVRSQDTDIGTCLFLQNDLQVVHIFCYPHFSFHATLSKSLMALVWIFTVIFMRVLTFIVALDLYGKSHLIG